MPRGPLSGGQEPRSEPTSFPLASWDPGEALARTGSRTSCAPRPRLGGGCLGAQRPGWGSVTDTQGTFPPKAGSTGLSQASLHPGPRERAALSCSWAACFPGGTLPAVFSRALRACSSKDSAERSLAPCALPPGVAFPALRCCAHALLPGVPVQHPPTPPSPYTHASGLRPMALPQQMDLCPLTSAPT